MSRPLAIAWKWGAITAAVWLASLLVQGLLLSGTTLAAAPAAPLAPTLLAALAATALTTAVLIYPALRSSLGGWRVAGALFVAIWGLHVVLVAVEGLVFLDTVPDRELLLVALGDTVVAALLAWLLARAFGRAPRPFRDASAVRAGAWWWIWRIALCAFCYLVLYFTAGALIWPAIRSFYESLGPMPDPALIFPLQLARGALYVLFVLPLLRSLACGRGQASLAMAVMFPMLAGVAALLIPNPVFPDWVRGYHLVEIGWSNFVFGALVGWLFARPGAGAASATAAAAAG